MISPIPAISISPTSIGSDHCSYHYVHTEEGINKRGWGFGGKKKRKGNRYLPLVAVKSQTDSSTDKGEGSFGKIVFLPFRGCPLYWRGWNWYWNQICCDLLPNIYLPLLLVMMRMHLRYVFATIDYRLWRHQTFRYGGVSNNIFGDLF